MKRILGSSVLAFIVSALLLTASGLAADAQKLVIGAIYVGNVNDYGYNQSFHDALVQVEKTLPGVKLLEAENVPAA